MHHKVIGYRVHQVGGLLRDDERCTKERAEQVAKIWRGLTGYIPIVAQREIKINGEVIFENIK